MSNKPYNVFVQEEFEKDGETENFKTQVGVAFPHKTGGGFNVVLRNNIAVSGRLVIFPPREDDKPGSDE